MRRYEHAVAPTFDGLSLAILNRAIFVVYIDYKPTDSTSRSVHSASFDRMPRNNFGRVVVTAFLSRFRSARRAIKFTKRRSATLFALEYWKLCRKYRMHRQNCERTRLPKHSGFGATLFDEFLLAGRARFPSPERRNDY